MKINRKHPRSKSLAVREKLVDGVKKGITSQAGLIAHGRGEAFDYLIGEKTNDFARKAITTGAAFLLLAKKPVISVNGNTAALVPFELTNLARLLDCQIEVNLFHFSNERLRKIESLFTKIDRKRVLISKKNKKISIPGINSKRAVMLGKGIGESDCVLIPLEDGDRCETLIKMGKKIITIDLNPLSRTARGATVTIVDNIVRCLEILISEVKRLKNKDQKFLKNIIVNYDNNKILEEALSKIRYHRFK